MKPASISRHLLPKQTWRDFVPIDMHFSAVSILIVALPSSEVPEGLTTYPVYRASSENLFIKAGTFPISRHGHGVG
jgi:hypothetical protein